MVATHQCFFTFEDDAGLRSTAIIHILATVDAIDALDFVGLMVNSIDPLVNGGIVRAGVSLNGDVGGHGGIGSTSDVEEKGQFKFRTVDNNPMILSLPTFDEGLVISGSKSIDTGQADVAAWLVDMLTGIAVPSTELIVPCDSRGEDLASQYSALEKFRGR